MGRMKDVISIWKLASIMARGPSRGASQTGKEVEASLVHEAHASGGT